MAADTLRFFRLAKDLKQQAVAEALHISQSTYSDLETGKVAISEQQAEELARLYDVSKDVFLHEGRTVVNHNIGESSKSIHTMHSFQNYNEVDQDFLNTHIQKIDSLIASIHEEKKQLYALIEGLNEERKSLVTLLERMLDR